MEHCATYQNPHHQLMVAVDLQQGEACWLFRFKLHKTHLNTMTVARNYKYKC